MIFDEPDSGVDVENVELIGKMMSEMLQRDKKPRDRRKSALIITHTGFIFSYVKFEGCVRECQRIQGRDEE